jgi:hypothetical protein
MASILQPEDSDLQIIFFKKTNHLLFIKNAPHWQTIQAESER